MNKTSKAIIVLVITLILLGWFSKSEAGFYIDAGVGFVKGAQVTSTISENIGDYTLSLSAVTEIPPTGVLILRGGYEYNNIYFEIESMGLPERHIEILSVYYRWKF